MSKENFEVPSDLDEPHEVANNHPPNVDPPPDGGLKAWLQVLGSFMLFLNTWGFVNMFGAYETYYKNDMFKDTPSSDISWIGSIQAFLLLIVGVATGPLYDAGYFNSLIRVGSFLVLFGMFMTSLCTTYWQVMLAQGITVGLGGGCLFVPSVAIMSTYFSKKRAFATGIAASGSGLGGIIYPIVFAQLQPRIGFGWTTRVIAFIALSTLSISIAVMRVRVLPPAKRRLVDLPAFKEPAYMAFNFFLLCGFMSLYIPYFYIQSFAIAKTPTSTSLAFYMLPIINAASIPGRLLTNFFADKTGALNMFVPCAAISALLAFCWLAIDGTAGTIVFCAFYGFFSGTFASLPPTAIASLTPDIRLIGTRMGMSFCFSGCGLLIGTPIAGVILNQHGWSSVQVFCGAMLTGATILCIIARFLKVPQIW